MGQSAAEKREDRPSDLVINYFWKKNAAGGVYLA